ncbi:cysteine proteinase [Guyanagaster necrorhizus]|uniref:Cysteine proteinase n=1 Tax=Guyanagaster necrorhizus TaxID=856835 RepID=A0A9P7W5K9_9AGAR|nr:cysteine proteinase [Guyanagaster necrorhizus MCA 3950]KAG7452558.1 cysteine proteinase [Guyanagaster necrorhizus MCA 3950]
MAGPRRSKLKKSGNGFQPPPPEVDDDDLMNDLMAQLDSRDGTVQVESAAVLQDMTLKKEIEKQERPQGKRSKDRFKERQARKAATLANSYATDDPETSQQLELEARQEEESIRQINPDGHCLFSAVADQLSLLGILQPVQANYVTVRLAASSYMLSHPDDFLPFLPSTSGEDAAGSYDEGLISPREFEQYCTTIRDTGAWGGEPEILALSCAFNVPIHVVQGGAPPVVVHNPNDAPGQDDIHTKRAVRISYHRRMYGLGEHYNSLRPSSGLTKVTRVIENILS